MPANDRLNSTLSLTSYAAVTPNDTVDVPAGFWRGLYIGVAGNVAVQGPDDAAPVTFVGLAAGMFHPMAVKRVWAANTTATSIVVGK